MYLFISFVSVSSLGRGKETSRSLAMFSSDFREDREACRMKLDEAFPFVVCDVDIAISSG